MKCWQNISPLLHAVFLTLFWFTLCLPSSENSATSIFEPGSHFLRILSLFCCKCCKYDLFIADFSLPQCNSRLAKCQDGIFNFFLFMTFLLVTTGDQHGGAMQLFVVYIQQSASRDWSFLSDWSRSISSWWWANSWSWYFFLHKSPQMWLLTCRLDQIIFYSNQMLLIIQNPVLEALLWIIISNYK